MVAMRRPAQLLLNLLRTPMYLFDLPLQLQRVTAIYTVSLVCLIPFLVRFPMSPKSRRFLAYSFSSLNFLLLLGDVQLVPGPVSIIILVDSLIIRIL
jgi:hypothetical protein